MEDWRSRLEKLIAVRGISQRELADQAKVSRSHITMLLNGERKDMTFKRVSAVAKVLGISLDWLATGETCQPQQLDPYEQELLDAFRSVSNQDSRLLMLDLMKHQARLAKQRE